MSTATTTRWVYLCEDCSTRSDHPYVLGLPGTDGICTRCGGLASSIYDAAVNDPQIAQWGAMEFTTSTTLAVPIQVVWDVNGYYRALGVPTDATRRDLRAAYQRLRGWESERITYIIKILLNEKTRAEYDAIPPGDLFFDIFIRRAVEAVIHDASSDMGPGEVDENYEREAQAIRDELDEKMNKRQVLDSRAYSDDDLPHWGWGYYRWRSNRRDTASLTEWQAHLVKALSDQGVTTRLSIGFAGAHLPLPWGLLPIGHRLVMFLRDGEQPTPELAADAATLVHQHLTAQPSRQQSRFP